jgi:hypothetical protein
MTEQIERRRSPSRLRRKQMRQRTQRNRPRRFRRPRSRRRTPRRGSQLENLPHQTGLAHTRSAGQHDPTLAIASQPTPAQPKLFPPARQGPQPRLAGQRMRRQASTSPHPHTQTMTRPTTNLKPPPAHPRQNGGPIDLPAARRQRLHVPVRGISPDVPSQPSGRLACATAAHRLRVTHHEVSGQPAHLSPQLVSLASAGPIDYLSSAFAVPLPRGLRPRPPPIPLGETLRRLGPDFANPEG